MPLYDFSCTECDHQEELLVSSDVKETDCPHCGAEGKFHRAKFPAPRVLTQIIPMYPGSLKQKAGYVHSHGDRNATKIQSGYGGSQGPGI